MRNCPRGLRCPPARSNGQSAGSDRLTPVSSVLPQGVVWERYDEDFPYGPSGPFERMNSSSDPKRPYRAVRRASPQPLYWQVEHDLRERITSGIWSPGDRIPSEHELGELYGASRITIRQALGNLASEGLLSREPGRGTFVRDWPSARSRVASFTEEMMRLGVEIATRMLIQRIEPADDTVASRFECKPGEPVCRVDRLRLSDGEPLAVQRSRLPAARFPGLESADLTGSLYRYLRETYGVGPAESDEVIFVRSIREDPDAGEALNIPPDACVFLIERLTFDDDGPVDFSRSLVRGDRYQIHMGMRRA